MFGQFTFASRFSSYSTYRPQLISSERHSEYLKIHLDVNVVSDSMTRQNENFPHGSEESYKETREFVLSARRALSGLKQAVNNHNSEYQEYKDIQKNLTSDIESIERPLNALSEEYDKVYVEYDNPDPTTILQYQQDIKRAYEMSSLPENITKLMKYDRFDPTTFVHSGGEGVWVRYGNPNGPMKVSGHTICSLLERQVIGE